MADVLAGNQQPGDLVAYGVPQPADVGGHDRSAAGLRLQGH